MQNTMKAIGKKILLSWSILKAFRELTKPSWRKWFIPIVVFSLWPFRFLLWRLHRNREGSKTGSWKDFNLSHAKNNFVTCSGHSSSLTKVVLVGLSSFLEFSIFGWIFIGELPWGKVMESSKSTVANAANFWFPIPPLHEVSSWWVV